MNLDGFLKGEYVINCETEDEARELFKKLIRYGKKWCAFGNLELEEDETNWQCYGEKTCYGFSDGLSYGTADFAYSDRKVIKFADLKGYNGLSKNECLAILKFHELTKPTEDKPDMIMRTLTKEENEAYEEYLQTVFTKTGRHFNDDVFSPTLEYLWEHKDEYAILSKENGGSFINEWYEKQFNDQFTEDLRDKKYGDYDIDVIYKLVPVWERETILELTHEEIEEKLGYKIKLKE